MSTTDSRPFRHRMLVGLAAAAAGLGLLTGCAAPVAGDSTSAGETPVPGGNLVYASAFDVDSFFWAVTNSWESGIIFAQVVDRLIYWDDESSELKPWLAESWEANADSTEFTLHLREGVTFSDGSPLDAQVVADNLTIKALGDPDRGLTRVPTFPPGFESATAVDESTVVVTFTRPAYGFLRALTFYHAGIVGQETLELDLAGASRIENIVGSGPFTFTSYKPGEEYLLTKRDDYDWAPEGVGHEGPAYLDTITVKIASEPNIRLGLLESGQAQLARDIPPADEQRLAAQGLAVLPAQQTATSIYLKLRPNSPATSDVLVRQALQKAIDRQEVVDTLYFTDLWKPASSLLNENVPGWIDLSDELAHDPDGANALLDQAGWDELDADGYRTKDGERLSLTLYPVAYIQNSEPELLQLAQQFKEIGVEVLVKKVDSNQLQAALADPGISAQITLGSVPQVTGPIYNGFSSRSVDPWFSSGGTAGDPELDALLETLSQAGDEDAFDAAIADVQRYLIEQAYVLPLEINLQTFAAAPSARDIGFDAYGRPFLYDAWIAGRP